MLGETVGTIDCSATGNLISRTIAQAGQNISQNEEVTITHIHLISGSGGGAVLIIANGQGGTQRINITGTASKGIDFDFGVFGVTFDKGAFVTVDGNISNAAITCKASKV